MNTKRIVITGGPGTGKTSIIKELIAREYYCLEEISRQVTIDAKNKGIDQLFLTDPLLFSDMLLKGRMKQFLDSNSINGGLVFFDRGLPDIVAYMNFLGTHYPNRFLDACQDHIYSKVFILAPWQEIYVSDNERYENYDQAMVIHDHLIETYANFGYDLHDVPFDSVSKRTDFILKTIATL